MSFEKESTTVVGAARSLVEGLSALVGWLVDEQSGAQILAVPVEPFTDWMHGRAELPQWLGDGDQPRLIDHARDLAEYAWGGTWHANAESLEETIAEFVVVSELLHRSPVSPSGLELFPSDACQTLNRLIQAVLGRQALDNPDGDLTIEQLSALAGVAEKTVRMAANPNQPQALRTQKLGHRTLVSSTDALEWLSRRRDFQRTRLHAAGPGQPTVNEPEALALACQRWSATVGLTPDTLAADMAWTDKQRRAYAAILSGNPGDVLTAFPPKALRALAERFGMPEPDAFATQAYRVLALSHVAALTGQRESRA